jgi:hypothetical protein
MITSCAGGVVLLAATLWLVSHSGADPVEPAAPKQDEAGGKAGGDSALPIRQVVLFNTGLGYFQREGQVDGSSRVELTFPAHDMNDLLMSLILQDGGGGKISAVNYDSYDPIEKTLRSFAIDLSANPTFGQILNQARGEKIEVIRVEPSPAKKEKDGDKKEREPIRTKVVGTIVGMETQARPGEPRELEILNVTTDSGLQAVPLEQAVSVRFLNAVLEREFQRALLVLARAHDTQKKTISLGFQGNGKRTVRVGYVVERPIWKTSYRLRIEDNGKLFLQAWAMVENTSDDDWSDVNMVLVSGRPISYKMNLYEPLWIPRPEVEPELFASLRPPTYGGSMASNEPGQDKKADADKIQPGATKLLTQQQFAQQQQQQLMMQQGLFGNNSATPYMNLQGGLGAFGYLGQNAQMNGNGVFNNRYANPNALLQPQGNFNAKLNYEQLQERQKQRKDMGEAAKKAVERLNFKEGIESVANAEEVGDYHQYALDQKISLPRQKSAMLPIVNKGVEGTKVSIYNASVHAKFPLLGLRFKNTSGQPLPQGPVAVFEGQTFAGDTRVLDLQPGEERLLSYAIDQGTEVVTVDSQSPGPELYFKVSDDQLATNYKVRHTRSYTLKNRSGHDRTTIIEHPITRGWKLLEPEKPAEKSRDVYRFEVKVAAGKSVTFEVTEEENRDASMKLIAAGAARTCDPREDIHVKLVHKTSEPKITGMRFEKGTLMLKQQVRESTSYFVQNLSTLERHANVDYVVRPGWRLLLDDEQVKTGPAVQRVSLKLLPEKTAVKEFLEERTVTEKAPPLATLSEERAKELLSSPAASAEVKASLGKALELLRKLQETKGQLADVEKELKALTQDQVRMRENLTVIPQSSEPYKKFLEKFVAQESELETLQKQLRQRQASVQQLQRDYDQFIANLTVE